MQEEFILMKKAAALLFLLAMIFALSACGGGSGNPAQEPASTPTADEASEAEASETEAGAPADTLSPVEAVDAGTFFVSPEWVNSVINGEQPQSSDYVIFSADWGEPTQEYLAAHIPGAVHFNTDNIEEEVYWNLRTPEEMAQVAKNYGVTKDTTVIVYGNGDYSGIAATRVAFAFFWAGVDEVKILDGHFRAWESAGFETVSGNTPSTPTDMDFGTQIPARPQFLQRMPDEVLSAQQNDNFRLVSIRSWEEFVGETSGYGYIPRAGEPAGAVWGHDDDAYVNPDGTIRDFSEITAMWAEWDITKDSINSFYCGTGWRATLPLFIAYQNGWENVMLYDGGWYVWQMDESLPVQVGDPR